MSILYIILRSLLFVPCLLQTSSNAEPLFGRDIKFVSETRHNFIVHISIKENNSNNLYRCSGALITSSHVLTVATCLNRQLWENAKVFVGISDPGTPGIRRYRIKSSITYNEWVSQNNLNANGPSSDIGIVELEKKITDISPAKISSKTTFETRSKVTLTGWGMVMDGTKSDPEPRRPQFATSSFLLDRKDCEGRIMSSFKPEFQCRIPGEYLCSPGGKHRISALPGDFGAPVLDKSDSVMGIMYGLCPGSEPGHLVRGQVNIILRIYDYIPFISSVTNRNIFLD